MWHIVNTILVQQNPWYLIAPFTNIMFSWFVFYMLLIWQSFQAFIFRWIDELICKIKQKFPSSSLFVEFCDLNKLNNGCRKATEKVKRSNFAQFQKYIIFLKHHCVVSYCKEHILRCCGSKIAILTLHSGTLSTRQRCLWKISLLGNCC